MARRLKTPYTVNAGITQSIIQQFKSCRVGCRFMLDEWEPPQDTRAIDYGNMWHALDEHYILAIMEGKTPKPGAFVRRFAKYWRKKQGEKQANIVSVEEDIAVAEVLFPIYAKLWKKDLKRNWVEAERNFDVKWKDHRNHLWRLRGKCDALYKVRKEFWLKETKTKGQISEDTISTALAFDFQNLFYIICKSFELKKQIKGVMFNVIRRPGTKRGQGESIKSWSNRILEAAEKKPDHYFKRYEVVYTKTMIEKFKKELGLVLKEFYDWLKGARPTYKSEISCIKRWNCKFLQACASGSMTGYQQTAKLFRELDE